MTSWRRAALLVFATQFAVLDLVLRRPPMRVWVPSAVGSVALWGLAASLSGRRWSRGVVAAAAAGIVVVQLLFFRYYHVFLDEDGVLCARHMWGDVRPILLSVLPLVALASALVGAVDYAALGAPVVWKSWMRPALLGTVIVAGLLVPLRDATPDLAAVSSLRGLLRSGEAHASSGAVTVPALPSRRDRLPSVLFILDESVRASDYDAATTPETTALTRGRVDLEGMRSVASYTSIAVASMLTSAPPTVHTGPRPCLFDFVRAIRRLDERPSIAYLSAQTDSLFEGRDVRDVTDAYVTVDDLLGKRVEDIDEVLDADVDDRLVERVEHELPKLRLPLFAVVHLAGTHAPYYVDDARAPFKPYRHTPTWSTLGDLHAAYRDAIFDQDAAVARVLRAFFARVGNEPALVVFTSDHGEAFGERGAIHHGQGLYDEQIHVPAWVLARGGALAPDQEAALDSHAKRATTHLDLVPTLLDAYGVLDSLPMRGYPLAGRSLLRTAHDVGAVPLTNCTDLFPCPVKTWGMLGETRLLVAQPWDTAWRCVDLQSTAEPLDDADCRSLVAASHEEFPALPNGTRN